MKRSVLTLFSGENDVLSHVLRLALVAKGIAYDIVTVSDNPEEAMANGAKGKHSKDEVRRPATIQDRELILTDVRIALDYLDDKYPHPALYPVSPEVRAKFRMLLQIIEQQAVPNMVMLNSDDPDKVENAKNDLMQFVEDIKAIFDQRTHYILGEEFTILDCYLAPLIYKLFRLSQDSNYRLPTIIAEYYCRIHSLPIFTQSLQLRSTRGFMYEKGK